MPGLPVCNSVLGPNDHSFPIGMNHSQPISQVSGGSETTHTPGDNPYKIQNHCQEPYYQAMPAGESPHAGEAPSIHLTLTKRPAALWAPTLLTPTPNSEPISLPSLISLLRHSHLHSPGPLERDTGQERGSSLCAWWVVTCQCCDYGHFPNKPQLYMGPVEQDTGG